MATVHLEGVGRFMSALTEIEKAMQAAAGLAVAAAGHKVEEHTKRTLTTTTHRKNEPTPSKPGEPPSLVRGTLRRSVRTSKPIRRGFGDYEVQVGPTVFYGRIQELGGAAGRGHASTLPARPYLELSLHGAVADGSVMEAYRLFWRRAWRAP